MTIEKALERCVEIHGVRGTAKMLKLAPSTIQDFYSNGLPSGIRQATIFKLEFLVRSKGWVKR